jgi:precorrin-6Y C5,15-methyltransferase (decarboxylating)
MNTIYVIGMGMNPHDLLPEGLTVLRDADTLAGGRRHLEECSWHKGGKLVLKGSVDKWLDEVGAWAEKGTVAVLASGDPGFYGILRRLTGRFGSANLKVVPGVTTVQAAFARLKLSWDQVGIVSLHGRSMNCLWQVLFSHDQVAIFTDRDNTPNRIAEALLQKGLMNWGVTVLEDLGRESEKVRKLDLEQASLLEFSPLNLVILSRLRPGRPLSLGLDESFFEHAKDMITKKEVRAVALAKLSLKPGQTLWDLGAGSGSVGIEASLLLPGGRVEAVEKNSARVGQIKANQARFEVGCLTVHEGEIMEIIPGLPRPDRVFVGGAGKDLAGIIAQISSYLRPSGLVVASTVLMDSMIQAREAMTSLGFEVDLTQVQVSRGEPLAHDLRLVPLNPVWLITGQSKPCGE